MRPTWDEYFLGIAQAVSARADCSRRQVGAVIVGTDRRLISVGYNGAPPGKPGCLTDGACPRANSGVAPGAPYDHGTGRCIAVHAEANAIINGDFSRMLNATIYCTDEPCHECARLIEGARIAHVIFGRSLL